eukprot:gene13852-13966_t
MKSNRETKKPKADKPKKTSDASSLMTQSVGSLGNGGKKKG